MSTRPLRVGVVGANAGRGWAAATHLPVLKLLDGLELAAVCTTRRESAEASARTFGAKRAFTDAAALARCDEVDLVAVSVRVPEHATAVRAALDAGKHVLCEWPLGRTTGEAGELAALAAAKGVLAVVGLQGRMSPELNCLRDLVRDGWIGEPLSATVIATNTTWGGRVPQASRFMVDRDNGVTALTVTGGHTLDAVSYALGEFREISGRALARRRTTTIAETGESVPMTAEDQVLAHGVLASGTAVSVHVRAGVLQGTGQLFEVNGTEGDLVLSADGPMGLQNALLRLRGSRGGEALADLPVPGKYRQVPDSVPRGRPYNVAQLYARIAARLRGENIDLPTFADAVGLHRLLDRVSGTR